MLLGEEAVRIGRLHAQRYLIADEAELIHLVAAVEPLPAAASSRHDLLIAAPPRRATFAPARRASALLLRCCKCRSVRSVSPSIPATPSCDDVLAQIERYVHKTPIET